MNIITRTELGIKYLNNKVTEEEFRKQAQQFVDKTGSAIAEKLHGYVVSVRIYTVIMLLDLAFLFLNIYRYLAWDPSVGCSMIVGLFILATGMNFIGARNSAKAITQCNLDSEFIATFKNLLDSCEFGSHIEMSSQWKDFTLAEYIWCLWDCKIKTFYRVGENTLHVVYSDDDMHIFNNVHFHCDDPDAITIMPCGLFVGKQDNVAKDSNTITQEVNYYEC